MPEQKTVVLLLADVVDYKRQAAGQLPGNINCFNTFFEIAVKTLAKSLVSNGIFDIWRRFFVRDAGKRILFLYYVSFLISQ